MTIPTDPFRLPSTPTIWAAKWAPTTGVSRHNFNLVSRWKLPSAVSVSLLAVSLAAGEAKVYANLGLQADNILSNKNYVLFGEVVGSPLFGRPLAALPGRSLRWWFNLDW